MSNQTQNPLVLLKGLVSSRGRKAIELPNYLEALSVLERHFSVYEQRLRVMKSPAVFPDGEVLLEAANQGLDQMRSSVESLRQLDPAESPEQAESFLEGAERGFGLLVQLRDVNKEKREEFIGEYEAYQEQN